MRTVTFGRAGLLLLACSFASALQTLSLDVGHVKNGKLTSIRQFFQSNQLILLITISSVISDLIEPSYNQLGLI